MNISEKIIRDRFHGSERRTDEIRKRHAFGTGDLAKKVDYGMCRTVEGFLPAVKRKIDEHSTLRNKRTLVVELLRKPKPTTLWPATRG
ncbi:MAG TPA: hypothetical protein ENO31_02785 [Thermoprotei archaeon]|nr:hypothetical protein [Thermoprotei archaeon]